MVAGIYVPYSVPVVMDTLALPVWKRTVVSESTRRVQLMVGRSGDKPDGDAACVTRAVARYDRRLAARRRWACKH